LCIPPQTEHPAPHTQPLSKRFQPIRVLDVSMAKLHTAAITAEPCANLRVCGFGGVVRGAAQHRLAPLKDLVLVSNFDDTHIVHVALGQDHTLALTRAGSVLSWGLSCFSQLGYAVDGSGTGLGAGVPQMVATLRRVVGPLKKELVIGVAACKTASACWTAKELFTWGSNNTQLGYDMAAVPVQVLPRRIAQVAQPVRNVALSGTAMAVLLTSSGVLCLEASKSSYFPTASFPPALTAYRPPAAQNNAAIAKVVCCENVFAALSSNGEMFAFRFPAVGSSSVMEANATQSKESKGGISAVSNAAMVKPQRVWALRKQFSAVKDVALGSDGTIVLCTESGPVYVRNRLAKTANAQHMPFLQRVVRVAASSAGAFAALQETCVSVIIKVVGNTLSKDLEAVRRWAAEELQWGCEERGGANRFQEQTEMSADSPTVIDEVADVDGEGQDESQDVDIKNDIRIAKHLFRREEHRGIFDGVELKCGADLLVQIYSGFAFPLHRIVLTARSLVLKNDLLGQSVKDNAVSVKHHSNLVSIPPKAGSIPKLVFSGLHPLTVVLLATYLYTDDVPALWDRRVGMAVYSQLRTLGPKTKVNPTQIRAELHVLAEFLRRPALGRVLDTPVKRVAATTLERDMQTLFDAAQPGGDVSYSSGDPGSETETLSTSSANPLTSDTVLELADRRVYCRATLLRARSPFFAAFFDDADWTRKRWLPDGTLHVDLRHLRWQIMEFVFRYLYSGDGEEIFEIL
ncbi:regulator of chromosome condensation 1/beta-lactamase-inhibitor protein II, partial [Phellopilus nigrolimitatus]